MRAVIALLLSFLLAPAWAQVPMTGAGAGTPSTGASFSLAWTDHSEVNSPGSATVNYGTLDIGAADANRIVVVAIGNRANTTSGLITSVTVGDVSATQVSGAVADSGAGLMVCDMWQAAVPTGTTAAVSIVYTNVSARSAIDIYRIVTATPTSTAAVAAQTASTSSGASLTSPSITVPTGGAMISIYGNRAPNNANDINWTNATKDFTAIQIGTVATIGSATTTTPGSTTITASITSAVAGTSAALSVAAWGP